MSGATSSTTLPATGGIDNQTILEVIGSTCRTLDVSLEQAAEDFGHHWVNEFAPRIYPLCLHRPRTPANC